MYTIYFENRKISIYSQDNVPKNTPNSVILFSNEQNPLSGMSQFLESKTMDELIIGCEQPKKIYTSICQQYDEINAAGGIIENEEDEVLMIFRNGKWDLPKGKQEEGEDIKMTARREVEEECGIRIRRFGKKVCVTDHTYELNGKKMLKHTYWYKMKTKKCLAFPQTEENITEVVWVKKENLSSFAVDSYPSIQEVLAKSF